MATNNDYDPFDPNSKDENAVENFDTAYQDMMEKGAIEKEFERIELARAKVAEKYESYQECLYFLDFLKTIEKVFAEAKIRRHDAGTIKDSLIETKISLMAKDSPLGEDVLRSIYDDFKKAGSDVGKIMAAAQALAEKYSDGDCQELISYIQYVFVNFEESKNKGIDELKDSLIRARMQVMSSDGKPELLTLENIYKEFQEILSDGLDKGE